MEKKLKQAAQCLYAQAGLSAIFYAYGMSQYFNLKASPEIVSPEFPLDAQMQSAILTSTSTYPALLVLACIYVARELNRKSKWSWVMAMTLFLVTATGFGLVVSIIGVLLLWNREIREHFLKEMEIEL